MTSTKSSLSHDQYLTRQQRAPPPSDRSYVHCALRLLDLLDTLYHRTAIVFSNNNEEAAISDTGVSNMWNTCWCPLLEVIIISIIILSLSLSYFIRLYFYIIYMYMCILVIEMINVLICLYSTSPPPPQGVARLCCDPRKNVRQAAIAYLQRELLAHTLHSLTALDWEACFLEVNN